mmetsp:Transcript_6388/g.21366  ORF Transcript_6388/g.21366 Transcript_6388/m.21366 type:complete len:552 (-) Transcript_6388:469-2124(-)|eukprot:CAMPEP_0170149626 /NCGR_PEP_ID=MMETSP0033_2-20121228/43616_1 /TAXON_ID=195969 /ORGANISM="Dolichomastix tenuilepis, Strain CCMP3274" /LENGTH=551 /DNA_ID=CAMNT_0010386595 /DNA_START=58 /DNA_END=1713 /DNA_ORIENTATION=-
MSAAAPFALFGGGGRARASSDAAPAKGKRHADGAGGGAPQRRAAKDNEGEEERARAREEERRRESGGAAAAAPPSDSEEDLSSEEQDAGSEEWSGLGLGAWLERNIAGLGLAAPTPVQRACIPAAVRGRDVVGCAETGTGKTAAFALPILNALAPDPFGVFAAVLTPTRELAFQISEQFEAFGAGLTLDVLVLIGGQDAQKQARALARRPHIVVASPGRLRDHLEADEAGPGSAARAFNRCRFLVLDEADRLLDASFAPELAALARALPPKRQTLMFSATMTRSVANARAATGGRAFHFDANANANAASASWATVPAEQLRQEYLFIPAKVKEVYLAHLLSAEVLEAGKLRSVVVFVGRARTAQVLGATLSELGVPVVALHAQLKQKDRLQALQRFKAGAVPILLATDVASRGLDIPTVDQVINYDVPAAAKDYVHRIGRTARAGRVGRATTFVSQYDVARVKAIEAEVGRELDELALEEATVLKGLTRVLAARRTAKLALVEAGVDVDGTKANNTNTQGQPRKNKQKQGRADKGRSEADEPKTKRRRKQE